MKELSAFAESLDDCLVAASLLPLRPLLTSKSVIGLKAKVESRTDEASVRCLAFGVTKLPSRLRMRSKISESSLGC